jgi:iron complex outermembrane receptor protein
MRTISAARSLPGLPSGGRLKLSDCRLLPPLAAAALALLPLTARAQAVAAETQTPPAATTLPTVEVIGTSPLLGSGIDRDKVPANARSFSPTDLGRSGVPDLSGTLSQRVPSVNVNDVQDNPFQPDIQFRGFDASPIQGTPQGLAVYQNGVRINEAYGDTVNWDLVPDFAINRMNLISNNPVFGLNALGGALAIEMKNGFNFQGARAEASGGSFGRRDGIVEYGVQSGRFASYVGGRALYEEGWREHSPTSLHQLYADVGARGERLSLDVSFAGASNLINAVGPTPVELLAANRNAIFTYPQSTRNDLAFLTVTGSYKASDTVSVDSNFYYRHFRQRIANGNTSNAQACDPAVAPNTLCFGDATTVLFANGAPVPNFLNGADPGQIDRTTTVADGLGGSLQMTRNAPLLDHTNHFVAGVSLDHGTVDFTANSELGLIEPSLLVSGRGLIIDQPDGSIGPVNLNTTNSYYGLYATDTFDLTSRLALTLSGRYNLALIHLNDLGGTGLNGNSRFSRFNPAAGGTYKILPSLTGYAGYSEANRAPTPNELGCADPAHPCILENFVVSDPPLKQVVARTYEAGLRGTFQPRPEWGRVNWNLGVFRTDLQDDIVNVPSPITGFGFFQNVGNTRRQGIEAGISYRSDRFFAYADYALVDATFQSAFTLSSPGNPFADANGQIAVRSGDHMPSIPRHRLKFGADYSLTDRWKFGADMIIASDQYLRGDQTNQNPKIPGYHVVNLHSSYDVTEHVAVFGLVQNLFDEKYETFGVLFDTTQVASAGLSNPRSLSPAPPLGVFVGVRATF